MTDGTGGTHDDIPDEVAASPHQLQVFIYRYIDDDGDAAASFPTDVDITPANTTFSLSNGLTLAPAQTVTLTGLPIGRFTAVIWCTNNTPADTTDDVVYDGDCNGGNIDHNPVYFSLTHNTSQVTIVWNLP